MPGVSSCTSDVLPPPTDSELCAITVPKLHVRKLRPREGKSSAQGHTAGKYQLSDSHSLFCLEHCEFPKHPFSNAFVNCLFSLASDRVHTHQLPLPHTALCHIPSGVQTCTRTHSLALRYVHICTDSLSHVLHHTSAFWGASRAPPDLNLGSVFKCTQQGHETTSGFHGKAFAVLSSEMS